MVAAVGLDSSGSQTRGNAFGYRCREMANKDATEDNSVWEGG
jgi:hypothetical protein